MATELRIRMDFSQFYLRGVKDWDRDVWLLERANEAPPSANTEDGHVIVVSSPHQWSFQMPINIETLDDEPERDRDDWDQVSENRLVVGPDGVLQIDSPLTSYATCHVDTGSYIAEISGRGFFRDRRMLGSTDGIVDMWRVRLWPDTGQELNPPKLFWRQ